MVHDLVGPQGARQPPAGRRQVRGHDRFDAPLGQHGDDGQPDRAAPDDEGTLARHDARAVDGVQPDGRRLGQGRVPGVEPVWESPSTWLASGTKPAPPPK